MKISLVTLFFENYNSLASIVLPNWYEYCKRHEYGLLAHRGSFSNENLPIGLQKTAFVHQVLFNQDNDRDAVLVLDLDILITNLTKKVEDFIDHEHDYFVTTGFNGLCNGSYIVKKTQGGKEILEYMLANKHNHQNEQDTLKYHLDDPVLKDRIKLFPYQSFGSFMLSLYPEHGAPTREHGNWEPGDFMLHLPSLSLERRIAVFQSPEVQGAIVR
jgi:hypothetical protein